MTKELDKMSKKPSTIYEIGSPLEDFNTIINNNFGLKFTTNIMEQKRICNVRQALQRLEVIDKLQEQLGCPLEVFVKLHFIDNIYDRYGNYYKISEVKGDVVMVDSELVYFSLSEYKNSWWLKEDKSE